MKRSFNSCMVSIRHIYNLKISKNKILYLLINKNNIHQASLLGGVNKDINRESKFDELLNLIKQNKRKYDASNESKNVKSHRSSNSDGTSVLVLSNGYGGFHKSVILQARNSCYLVNCGESTHRILKENHIDAKNMDHVLITRKSWKAIGGLLSYCLIKRKAGFTVHTPYDVIQLLHNGYHMLRLNNFRLTRHNYKRSPFENQDVKIDAVVLKETFSNEKTEINSEKIKQPTIFNEESLNDVINQLNGDSLSDEVVNNDVSEVKTSNIVYAYIFQSKFDSVKILILDCPHENYINSVINNKLLNSNDIDLIVHLSPSNVLNNEIYRNWIISERKTSSGKKSCKHIILDENYYNQTLRTINVLQKLLNYVDKNTYGNILKHFNTSNKNFLQIQTNNVFYGTTMSRYLLYKDNDVFKFKLRNEKSIINFDQIDESQSEMFHLMRNIVKNNDCKNYPKIIFLGTCASRTSSLRNSSGILVKLNTNNSIILDCGEGTFGQFMRYFGEHEYKHELAKLKAVFISHFHGDHHLGLMMLLDERKKVLNELLNKNEITTMDKLYLIVPDPLLNWLYPLNSFFQEKTIFKEVTIILNKWLETSYLNDLNAFISNYDIEKFFKKELIVNKDIRDRIIGSLSILKKEKQLKEKLDVKFLKIIPVVHVAYSYGIQIDVNNFNFIYSGDCRPSKPIIDAGKNCDLLIHEATLSNDQIIFAKSSYHSTLEEACHVTKDSCAKNTILTHFGESYMNPIRIYAHIKKVKKENDIDSNIFAAFDYMCVTPDNLPYLASHMHAINYLIRRYEKTILPYKD